jgi:uncharacterized membrane protein YcaP (DUF421 family)
MEGFFEVDWEALFVPSLSLFEIFIRGTVTYLAVFTLLRLVLKREAGSLGISDLLVVVLMAEAAHTALSGEYTSITEGIILVGIILGWDYLLDVAGYHIPFMRRFVHPPPTKLIDNGKPLTRNLRKEYITMEELMGYLRTNGVDEIAHVKKAYLEGDGDISVVLKDEHVKKTGESQHPGGKS